MVIPEFTIYLILALGAGTYLGYGAGEKSIPVTEVLSYRETSARMKQCRQFCGKDRTAGFSALDGECNCHQSKKK